MFIAINTWVALVIVAILLALFGKAKLFFAWYDLWVGIFYDKKKKTVYFFPVPTVGFKIIAHKHDWRENGRLGNIQYYKCFICSECKNRLS